MQRKVFRVFAGTAIVLAFCATYLVAAGQAHAGAPTSQERNSSIGGHILCENKQGVNVCGANYQSLDAALLGGARTLAPNKRAKRSFKIKVRKKAPRRNVTQGFFADRVRGPKPWSAH